MPPTIGHPHDHSHEMKGWREKRNQAKNTEQRAVGRRETAHSQRMGKDVRRYRLRVCVIYIPTARIVMPS